MPINGPSDTIPKSEKKFLIFLGSSTPEKLRDYQYICEQKGWPIYFRDVRELLDAFHSSEEKRGKYKGNAIDKLKEVQGSIITMLENSDEALRNKCADYGFPYDPAKIFFATEDGGFRVPKPVWEKMDKTGIPEEVLRRIDKNKDNPGSGPDVETAPVMSAVLGAKNLMRRIIAAAKTSGQTLTQVTERSILTLQPFNAQPTQPPIQAVGHTVNYLHDPGELNHASRISTFNFVRPKHMADRSCADLAELYVAQHSARAKAIDDLAKKFGLYERDKTAQPLPIRVPQPFILGLLPQSHSMEPHIGLHGFLQQNNGQGSKFAVHYPESSYFSDQGKPSQSDPVTSRQLLGSIEDVVKESDGMVLLPDAMADPSHEKRFEKFYTLFSLIVAKQLVARDMQKPIVILNHDGSWDEAIANHNALVNLGLTKDFAVAWPEKVGKLPKNASVQSNGYFDVIKAASFDDSLAVALQLLNKKRERYQRRHLSDEVEYEGGVQPSDGCFKVALFCSACNENEQLNGSIEKVSYRLSKNDFGIVYGAGDRYTMGAVLNGVLKHRQELIEAGMTPEEAKQKAWIGGISTAPILVSETERGQFSHHLSYHKQTKTIYDRMADMLDKSNAIIVAPGGAGTLQEWIAPLMMKKLAPDLFKDKPIIVYNPQLFGAKLPGREQRVWDMALKSFLGDDYSLLTDQPTNEKQRQQREARCRELGIYLENDEKSVVDRVDSVKHQLARPVRNRWAQRKQADDLSPLRIL